MKICGVTRGADARAAQRAGADYVGLILTPGFGRSVTPEAAAALVAGVSIARVAVVVDETPTRAARAARSVGAAVVQLHGDEGRETVRALRQLGDWAVWKAVRARSLDDLRSVVDDVGDLVDGILVEGWKKGVMGGGGVRLALDPDEVRSAIPDGVAFVLAGGLEPGSVAAAVARFRPDVVDVSSGVEAQRGVKSEESVDAFVRAARGVPPPD